MLPEPLGPEENVQTREEFFLQRDKEREERILVESAGNEKYELAVKTQQRILRDQAQITTK